MSIMYLTVCFKQTFKLEKLEVPKENITKIVAQAAKAETSLKVKVPKAELSFLKKTLKFLKPFGNYLRGAWAELKLVRWPTRKMTWELTAAVLGFSAFFVVFILLLDALFKYLFNLILK